MEVSRIEENGASEGMWSVGSGHLSFWEDLTE